MVKKPIILFFGASSGIVEEILKYFKNNYQIYAFYNKNKKRQQQQFQQQKRLKYLVKRVISFVFYNHLI